MNKTKTLRASSCLFVALLAFATGCAGLYRGTVTLTRAVDSASTEYARLYNDGLISADLHAKVTKAHGEYRKAAGVAHDALLAYQVSGDPANYNAAFESARSAGLALVQLIVPYLTQSKSAALTSNIKTANSL